uniref:Uncharacterized protein n=1 Tax=Oryza barthii TaxID=65489 RepID=A0A0D3H6M7_9ORYZ
MNHQYMQQVMINKMSKEVWLWSVSGAQGVPTGESDLDMGMEVWLWSLDSLAKFFTLSYQMFGHMHRVLNINEKKQLITDCI